jgi:serine/threonine-protein kinase
MQILGHYRIDAQIGQGAMGVVYRAVDERLERTVALKVLRLSLSDAERAEYAARLQQEAKSAARLNHPGIITVYDCGDAGGYAFLAMEFVEGKSLQALTDGGVKFSIGRVQKLADQLFGALAYAHEHGVVHRDIKPANLMLTPDGRLKVTDFGIALLPASDLTRTGTLVGSPRHMAPEQVEGKKVDGRADLFAAGIVLYELLTGTKPFDGEHLASIAYKILHEPVADPRTHNPDVPEALAGVVMRCLEKDPERRFQTAREARNVLRASASAAKATNAGDTAPPSADAASPSQDDETEALPVQRAYAPWVAGGAILAVLVGAVAWRSAGSATPVLDIKPANVAVMAPPAPAKSEPVKDEAPAVTPPDPAPQDVPAKALLNGKPAPAEPVSIKLLPSDEGKSGGANKGKGKPKVVEHPASNVQTAKVDPDVRPAPVHHAPAAEPSAPEPEQVEKQDKRTFWQRLRGCDENGNCPQSAPRPVHDK